MSSLAASSMSWSASGGPSIRTVSGSKSSSARSSERAEPGPWWRIPKTTCSLMTTPHPECPVCAGGPCVGAGRARSQCPAGAVERAPAVALAHHRLQVLLPDHLVLDRVLHDRAGQPAREVLGA